MNNRHLTIDDMPMFTALRMTAFGEAVIEIANDAAFDDWTFSDKIRHALAKETTARRDRRLAKLLTFSRTPNPAACVEDVHYLPGRSLNPDVISRLAACRWLENGTNIVILGTSSVGKSFLAQALVNAACRLDYTALYYRLDDLANELAILQPRDPERKPFLDSLRAADLLVLDDFLTTPIASNTAADLLNILASREGHGSTVVTSQFDPEDWWLFTNEGVVTV
ncbi:ATP-binding protein [Gulosibacter chungangensis]|uniref:ATP-binding protein n=1 Tax=Gulosibacter chungangensis TaxID=979746 RepID=A0A7J5B7C2_9MICO|nr:ATP-binding protein [Gulosibacter chungangensis]KAB1640412.1 ATP-binding protein [Gulosibacter chungangensis]